MRSLERVLIINRGAIALRAVQACLEMGLEAYVLCSRSELQSRAARLAHRRVEVEAADELAVYLDQQRIVDLALTHQCAMVYPGYGFLAENAEFAARCEQAGLRFVGPGSEVLRLFGDKLAAKSLAERCKVSVLPGSGPLTRIAQALKEADRLTYPVMLKAQFGGGGRGIRRVEDDRQLVAAYQSARREAAQAFDRGTLYLEGLQTGMRHVEVQLAGDGTGQVVSLGERDCSLQRRHQKVVEETPVTGMDSRLLGRIRQGARRMMEHVCLQGVATVEFLAGSGQYFFLEVNPRIQVEHGITEAVTGQDLVKLQLALAQHQPLMAQQSIRHRGHAIECRIYAILSPRLAGRGARITRLEMPSGVHVNHLIGCTAGQQVLGHFDPLLAKLVVWGQDRDEALARMQRALTETVIEGVPTNLPLLRALFKERKMHQGNLDTAWLEPYAAAVEDGLPADDSQEGVAPVDADSDEDRARWLASLYQAIAKAYPTSEDGWRLAARRGE